MKQSVNFNDFIQAFHNFNRYNQFGYEALQVLFDYLEQYEEDTGEEIELDVIALCCDYSADTVDEVASNYGIDLSDCETDEERMETVTEYLTDNTSVCGVTENGTIVYCSAF